MPAVINIVETSFTDDTEQLFKHFFIRGVYRVKNVQQPICLAELQMERWR